MKLVTKEQERLGEASVAPTPCSPGLGGKGSPMSHQMGTYSELLPSASVSGADHRNGHFYQTGVGPSS